MNVKPLAVADIVKLLRTRGGSQYGGEAVTQIEHALQSAALAEQEGSPPTLIVAALLHDIGHLLHDLSDNAPNAGVDDRHETSGHRFLERLFDASVTEPVRLHVDAKRYLCTTDAHYADQLSEPSRTSLVLQCGLMSPAEVAEFKAHAHADDAIRLRRWDDLAKIPAQPTPDLNHFARYLNEVAQKGSPR